MYEIRILELLIFLFLLVPLIQPWIRDLYALEGLLWFPPLALLCGAALFPVYGFRPEGIPLLILTLILNIRTVPALISLVKRQHPDTSQGLTAGHTIIFLVVLGITAAAALYFAPVTNTTLITDQAAVIPLKDEARNSEFFLRIYESPEEEYQPCPVILVIPPMIGSITVVDRVCGALAAQGFKVISYSRRRFDSPAVGERGVQYRASLGTVLGFLRASLLGTSFEKSNALGRTLEEERKKDILFLLTYIKETLDLGSFADKDALFLAGYGAGGSALVLIGESPEYIQSFPQVKGLIAVESPLWSIYQGEDRQPLEPPEEAVAWVKILWSRIANGLINLQPKKIIGLEHIPRPGVPTLFLVSDRSQDRRYRPLVRILQTPAPAAMASVPGAGILDYSDYPGKYPLYAAFFSGSKPEIWKNEDAMAGTASVITRFAALVLGENSSLRPEHRLLENVSFETGGGWNLPTLGYILVP